MTRKLTVALAGNPNAGKSTVFNAITGARQHVANYPGVTVEKKYGKIIHRGHEIEVVDLPGVYSLTAYSLEEIVARDFLVNEKPDVVVDIVDASNLDRNLYLALQFKELGVPLIIALNMVDVAESRGIRIDHERLSSLLQVSVVPTVARSHKGMEKLVDQMLQTAKEAREWHALVISYGRDVDQGLEQIQKIIEERGVLTDKYPPRWIALKCLEQDTQIWSLLENIPEIADRVRSISQRTEKHIMDTLEEDTEAIIADHRYGYIAGITKKCIRRKIESRLNLSDQLDKVLTNRIVGPFIMLVILYGMYSFTFSASEIPLQWLNLFFDGLKKGVVSVLPSGNLQSLLISGIIDGVGGVLGFVPLIMFMFLAIALLEDSGYMARVAYMLDRVLRWFGLHGSSVLALIVSGGISGGCAVPGVMATRTLKDPKERIATLLVVPFMNCGAKLPVFAMLIGAFFTRSKAQMMFLLTLLSWLFALFAAKTIRSTFLKGPKTPFVMELPPYRMPTLQGLAIHTWERTWQYIKKAGTIILGFSILQWAMMTYPGLSAEQKRAFEGERKAQMGALLASPEMSEWVRNEKDVEDLNKTYERYLEVRTGAEGTAGPGWARGPFLPLVKTAFVLETGKAPPGGSSVSQKRAAERYLLFRHEMADLRAKEGRTALMHTAAGWIGRGMEVLSRPLGFDYRINVALLGGFAAKEVILSTLGTAYSLGSSEASKGDTLPERLQEDPLWTPLLAFCLILFTMLYVPCLPTVISIRKESSTVWAGFSIGFNLVAAYVVTLITRQVGLTFGLGS